MVLKIADFGLSDLQTKPNSLSGTLCGSPLYAAPELMTEVHICDICTHTHIHDRGTYMLYLYTHIYIQAKLALGNALRLPRLRSPRAHDRGAFMVYVNRTHSVCMYTYTHIYCLYVICIHAHTHAHTHTCVYMYTHT